MPETTRRLRGMIMTLTERCNLRCDYCYVPVERGRNMSPKTAAQATDWFLANAAPEGRLTLSFFGGEPFLAGDELRDTTGRVRAGLRGRELRVTVPTNAFALTPELLAWCRREGIELAISIDGAAGTPGRNHATGRSCSADLVAALPQVLDRLRRPSVLARMTVTPANVGALCANVRALTRMGLHRVAYVADDRARWDEDALARWAREHERIARWLMRAEVTAEPVPDLTAWRAILARLSGQVPRRRCGAGISAVTVTPDGAIFPCYRFAYAVSPAPWRLGDVQHGLTQPERVAQLERLDPDRLRPERGDCRSCPAADGCTHFCPALGFIAHGDVGAVPELACRLMQAQVAAVRRLHAHRSDDGRGVSPSRSRAAAAAVMAVAITGVAACQLYPSYTGRTDAGDARRTSDVVSSVPQMKLDVSLDRVLDTPSERAPAADAGQSEASAAVDGDRLEADDPYQGGYCPPYAGGYCP